MPPSGAICSDTEQAGCQRTGLASADLELFRRNADVDLHLAVDDAHRVGVHREDRGQRPHFAGGEIEARAVAGALHQAVLELALAERPAIVRADVVDRTPGPVV